MRAVRFVGVGRPLEMQDIPIPAIGDRDVLVKVEAAGICHSDAHYRAGVSPMASAPLTLGHEVAGVVVEAGARVSNVEHGDRVCLHYNITCGDCHHCSTGNDQFCDTVAMLGHHTDGGYAEYIAVPARNAFHLPGEIPFEHGATLMCASATAYHALRRARIRPGDTAAIFGAGGLGQSAIQLARASGALAVYAVDVDHGKLTLAEHNGAIPIDASRADPVATIRALTGGKGVDVAIEMVGMPRTITQAIECAGVLARVVIVGITSEPVEIDTYRDLLGREVELIGSNDHHRHEIGPLLDLARTDALDVSGAVTRTVPLDATAINTTLDQLEHFGGDVRTVIVPGR